MSEDMRAAAGRINDLIYDLWYALERSGPRYDQFELTGQQHAVLGLVVTRDPITPGDLAEALGVTKGAISQHLTVLEKDGYLSRRRSAADGRVQVLHLEERGQAYRDVLREFEECTVDRYVDKLSPTDIEAVVAALTRLRDVFAD